jgi:cell wall-associated NlpC family hydrolase
MNLIKAVLTPALIVFSLFTIGCSSSSYSNRYGKDKYETQKEDEENSRFTSKDTVIHIDTSMVAYDEDDDEEDYEPDVDSVPMDPSGYLKKLNDEFFADTVTCGKDLMLIELIKYMNTPYKYAGSSFDGIDCSGLTCNVYRDAANVMLPRSSSDQFQIGETIGDKDSLKFGDLVFFNTRRRSNPGHVGIYLGDGHFAHASRKKGVMVNSLDETYYKKRYVGARRINDF